MCLDPRRCWMPPQERSCSLRLLPRYWGVCWWYAPLLLKTPPLCRLPAHSPPSTARTKMSSSSRSWSTMCPTPKPCPRRPWPSAKGWVPRPSHGDTRNPHAQLHARPSERHPLNLCRAAELHVAHSGNVPESCPRTDASGTSR